MADTWLDLGTFENADGTIVTRRAKTKLGAELVATDNEANNSTDLEVSSTADMADVDLFVKSLMVGVAGDTPGVIGLATGDEDINAAIRLTDVHQTGDTGTSHYDRVLGLGCFNMDQDGNLIDPQRLGFRVQLEYEPTDNGTLRTVTGATNATPIVVTVSEAVATLAEGDTVYIEGVLGNTAANGYFKAKNVNVGAKTFELYKRVVGGADTAVAGTGVYTGGGKVVDRMALEFLVIVLPPGLAATAQLRPFTMRFNANGTFKSELSLAGTTRFYSSDSVTPLLQIPDGTGALEAILGTAGTSVSFTSPEKIDITAAAASAWQTSAGGLTVTGASTLALSSGSSTLSVTSGTTMAITTTDGSCTIDVGGGGGKGLVVKIGGATVLDVGATDSSALTMAAGKSIAGAAGAGGLSLGSMTGATAMPTGNLVWSGADTKVCTLTANGANGDITITSNGGDVNISCGDDLTLSAGSDAILDAVGVLSIGTGNATDIRVGRAAATTTVTGALKVQVSATDGVNLAQSSAHLWILDGYNATTTIQFGNAQQTNIDVHGTARASVSLTTPTVLGESGSIKIGAGGDALAFFAGTARTKQSVTGALSSVTDANAKAVLTSIIAALAAASGYNLVTDATT